MKNTSKSGFIAKLKQSALPHLLAIVLFATLSLTYFNPVLKGKEIQQGDVTKWEGMSQELREYHKATGKGSCWTGSMFSGMPSYHVGYATTPGPQVSIKTLLKPLQESIDHRTVNQVFAHMLFFYILVLAMGGNVWIAILGALAFAFSSYNFIIIEAGHVTKGWAIAYMALVVAGVMLTYKKRYLLGGALTALALAQQINWNHYQITFYLAMIVTVFVLGHMIQAIREKTLPNFLKGSAVLLVAAMLALASNAGALYSNLELGKESIRGKSELTPLPSSQLENEPQSSGLDKDYAFAWSYGKAESMTLIIPNFNGGSSGGHLGPDSEIYKLFKASGQPVGKSIQFYTYWGEQPFTSGPVYLGAIVCFLFVLGLFLVKHPIRFWLLGLTILSLFLAWGHNFAWFNDFLFYHLPFYNKFRAPAMALVIAQFSVPLLGVLALIEFFKNNQPAAVLKKALLYALGITGGLLLIFAVAPGIFVDFRSAADASYGLQDFVYETLLRDRESLLKADAWRSLAFIVAAATLLWLYISKRIKPAVTLGLIALLVLTDLWLIDKRYVNDSNFVSRKKITSSFTTSKADKEILKDTDLSYRVLNLNNPFNDSFTSYHHKSIGGYNAAKLRRYQDLIERKITNEMQVLVNNLRTRPSDALESMKTLNVLNMLNTRYVIVDPNQPPLYNAYAYGNAWFVDNYVLVPNADTEMATLDSVSVRHTAIIDQRFEPLFQAHQANAATSEDSISLISYAPDKLRYKASVSQGERMVVFSEVYYAHGWRAFVNGIETPHFRTNWILRGMFLPEGVHEVEFRFEPQNYYTAGIIGKTSQFVLLVALLASIVGIILQRNKKIGELDE